MIEIERPRDGSSAEVWEKVIVSLLHMLCLSLKLKRLYLFLIVLC